MIPEKFKSPCYPNCIVYPICKNKSWIVCHKLQQFWVDHYMTNERDDRKAWDTINEQLPNLESFKGYNNKYNLTYFRNSPRSI